MSRGTWQSDVERVREATDLVALVGAHVSIRPRGREHVGLCPFHDDHSPSFSVVTHKGNAFYKCHACGAAGDAFTFVMQYHRLEFGEAMKYLAERAGIALEAGREQTAGDRGPTRATLRRANAYAAGLFRRWLEDEAIGAPARAALAERGIEPELAERFGLGFAPPGFENLAGRLRRKPSAAQIALSAGLLKRRPDGHLYDAFRNRLIFPICDELGTPIAFGGRRMNPEDEPKYLNSAESPLFQKSRTLYGLHLARRAIADSRRAIITEGYTDVIACHRAGICNVVGTLGTALTRDHARVLARLCDTVVLVFDGDEAGQRAADRAVEVLFSEPVDVRICVLPGGEDPDDLLRKPGGIETFNAAVEASSDALVYLLERFRRDLDAQSTLAGREKALTAFLEHLVALGFAAMQGVRKRWMLSRLAELLGVPVGEIERAMPRGRGTGPAPRTTGAGPATAPAALEPTAAMVSRSRRLAEHELLSVLIFEPSCAGTPLQVEGGSAAPVTDLISPDSFIDVEARTLCGLLFARLRAGETVTMQELLAEIEAEGVRRLAASLYFEGQRRCGDDTACAVEALAEAAAALLGCIEIDRYRAAASTRLSRAEPDQRLQRLQELLEQRRRCGDLAAAIPQDVRT